MDGLERKGFQIRVPSIGEYDTLHGVAEALGVSSAYWLAAPERWKQREAERQLKRLVEHQGLGV